MPGELSRIKLHKRQTEVFVNHSRFKVVVAGRRWGKCLASGTKVQMWDGSTKPIEAVEPGDTVATICEDTYRLQPKPVVAVKCNGERETLRVKTSSRELVGTPNHPLLINNKWTDMRNISVGDLLGVAKNLKIALNAWRKNNPSELQRRRYEEIKRYSDVDHSDLVEGDVAWEKIVSVETADPCVTYDLQIKDNHNFLANGAVSHNSVLAKAMCVQAAATKKRAKVWYVAPSYTMAKNIMWDDMKEAVPRDWVKSVNETRMSIRLKNGSLIECKGADRPDSLRGVGLYFVVLDEFQDMKKDTWTRVIRPTLAKDRGNCLVIGTPKGFQGLYDLYRLGQPGGNSLWKSWQFPTITSPFIPKAEIEDAMREMDEKSFAQEFLARFESMSGRVYYAFDPREHVGNYAFNPTLPIWIGQDFNLDPMSSVVLQPQPDGSVWAVDEIYLRSSNTLEVCEELERRYWRYMGTKPEQITIYPDPAGAAGQHARGESDLDIFREKGFRRHKYRKKHPRVADRVNAVNRMLKDATGAVRIRIDAKCVNLIASLDQTLYREGTRDIDKRPGFEHPTDALGYPIELEFPSRPPIWLGSSI